MPHFSTDRLLSLESRIRRDEQDGPKLKRDNEARIVWAEEQAYHRTPFSLVYLHGFTASQGEGAPVHVDFARRFGMNLYLCRLARHGMQTNRLTGLTPQELIESASKALKIGKKIGERVILMGTSTGASLALYLGSIHPDIKAIIMYSPLIRFHSPLIHRVAGRAPAFLIDPFLHRRSIIRPRSPNPNLRQYWYDSYDICSLRALETFIRHTMNRSIWQHIRCPVFTGYYYKDKRFHDKRISIPAVLTMYRTLATPAGLKRKRNFPSAGSHIIACKYTSQAWKQVEDETFLFAEELLHLRPPEASVSG